MRLSVRHQTRYGFDTAVTRLVQSHRLWPSDFGGQRVLSWQIETPGAVVGSGFRDGAGDWTQTVAQPGPVTELTITAAGEVETTDTAGVLRNHRERVPPSAYLRSSARTAPDGALRALADPVLQDRAGDDALALAHALNAAVSKAVRYRPGDTREATTAAEALAGGSGVCQDHAHVLIAAAHHAGLPARYVAGYLFAGGGLQGSEASHAWAEIWIERLGWVGFDAANACCPDDRYIRLCSGYDSADAAPVRGVLQGAAAEVLDVSVAVSDARAAPDPSQGQSQRQQ